MRTDDSTLIKALNILSSDIESGDGVANACIAEAALRLQELVDRVKELEQTVCMYDKASSGCLN